MSKSVSIRLNGISKTYGHVQALEPFTLDVIPGEMLALLGPSGCGKTTTLRIIAGFEVPDTGNVLIADRDVTDLPPNKRGLGMVFQSYSLFPHMTVGENVAFGLRMRGVSQAERTARAREMLDLVRLGQFEDRSIHQLSGGQQQRIALARSLVTDPQILLLDEPLGALDKNLRERMQFELREIQKRLGITSILVTHDQEEALTMSDRVAVMAEGRIVQIGTPTEIYERPQTQFISEFLGTANVFRGNVIGPAAGSPGWQVKLDDCETETTISSATAFERGQQISFAVRPERMRIGDAANGGLIATMKDVVFRGSYFAYEFRVASRSEPIFVYTQMRADIPENGVVSLIWSIESAISFRSQAAA